MIYDVDTDADVNVEVVDIMVDVVVDGNGSLEARQKRKIHKTVFVFLFLGFANIVNTSRKNPFTNASSEAVKFKKCGPYTKT